MPKFKFKLLAILEASFIYIKKINDKRFLNFSTSGKLNGSMTRSINICFRWSAIGLFFWKFLAERSIFCSLSDFL